MTFLDFSSAYLPKIETCLEDLLSVPKYPIETLHEAACWAVLSGGKRLRPLLLLATIHALKGPVENGLTAACGVEFLHTYSLIHDDLPCMDNDDFRRGVLTVHKKFNEPVALLTGDFLLTYAFEVISRDSLLTDKQKISLVKILSTRSGAGGMIGGQLLDLKCEALSLDELSKMHKMKTADLISGAVEMGAIIAAATDYQKQALDCFGQKIGLAFQIIDDILDITDSVQKHGKEVSSDMVNGKRTYPSFLGLSGAKTEAKQLLASALDDLSALPSPTVLSSLTEQISKRMENAYST